MDVGYWRLARAIEVDLVVGDAQIAIDMEASTRIAAEQLKGLIVLCEDQPGVRRRIMVCLERGDA